VPRTITYYAVIDDESTRDRPAGIVRRLDDSDEGFVDEGLYRDLGWHRTSAIVEWERAESTDDLIEVSEDEANRIIEQFRARWSAEG
jgi:hypothetical protein